MPNSYPLNTQLRLAAAFTDATSGATVTPTTVTITIRAPDLTTTTPTVTNPSVGNYQTLVLPTQSGRWLWRASGTGAVAAQQDGEFEVVPNTF